MITGIGVSLAQRSENVPSRSCRHYQVSEDDAVPIAIEEGERRCPAGRRHRRGNQRLDQVDKHISDDRVVVHQEDRGSWLGAVMLW